MLKGMILKDEIVRLRLEKGWEQIDLARRAGVKQQTLSLIESGDTKSSKFIGPLADALGVPVSQIDTSFAEFGPRPLQGRKNAEMLQAGTDRIFPYYAAAEGGDGAIILSWDAIEYGVPRRAWNTSAAPMACISLGKVWNRGSSEAIRCGSILTCLRGPETMF